MPGRSNANRGGNCNTTVGQDGTFYVNLNNTASNTNWNIGASQSYQKSFWTRNVPHGPLPLEEINALQSICK